MAALNANDVHDPQVRGALLRGLLLQLPADGRVDAAAVDALAACVRRHHLLQPLSLAGTGGSAAPLHEWLERLLHLLSSPKVCESLSHPTRIPSDHAHSQGLWAVGG